MASYVMDALCKVFADLCGQSGLYWRDQDSWRLGQVHVRRLFLKELTAAVQPWLNCELPGLIVVSRDLALMGALTGRISLLIKKEVAW